MLTKNVIARKKPTPKYLYTVYIGLLSYRIKLGAGKMSTQILKDIVEAEKKIGEMADHAKRKAEQIIREADTAAKVSIERKKKELEEKHREKMGQIKRQLEETGAKKAEEAKKQAAEIRRKAEKNIKMAVDYIYGEFLNTAN